MPNLSVLTVILVLMTINVRHFYHKYNIVSTELFVFDYMNILYNSNPDLRLTCSGIDHTTSIIEIYIYILIYMKNLLF